jgi:hypothetical protein
VCLIIGSFQIYYELAEHWLPSSSSDEVFRMYRKKNKAKEKEQEMKLLNEL